jgi:NAD(P)-dependent dehydrogenase (short-subunit alcohol dehydrogenase family)
MSGWLAGEARVVTGTGAAIGRRPAYLFGRKSARVVACDLVVEAAEETIESSTKPEER